MFLELGLNKVDGLAVVYDSVELYKDENVEKSIKMIAATGGCCALLVNEELLPIFKTGIENVDDRRYQERMEGLALGPIVVLSKEVFGQLSEEEQDAIFFHEAGHIRLGHLNTTETGILNDIDKELEADAYAASKTSKAAMRNGLIKIIKTMIDVVGTYKGKSQKQKDKAFKESMKDKNIARRLEALV